MNTQISNETNIEPKFYLEEYVPDTIIGGVDELFDNIMNQVHDDVIDYLAVCGNNHLAVNYLSYQLQHKLDRWIADQFGELSGLCVDEGTYMDCWNMIIDYHRQFGEFPDHLKMLFGASQYEYIRQLVAGELHHEVESETGE